MTIKQQGGIFGRNPTFNETTSTTSNTDALYVTDKAGINATSSQIPALTKFQIGSVGSGSDATYSGRLKLDDQPTSLQQGGGLEFMTSTFGSGYGWKVSSISSSGVHLVIGTRQNSADWTEVARFNSSGNLAFPSGQGIDFSATSGTGTSELFDDYEEGTWTPTVTPSSGSFTTVTITYATYTKIGDRVYFDTRFVLTNSGTGSGTMTASGLPFTPAASQANMTVMGRNAASGNLIYGQIGTSGNVGGIRDYDKTSSISNAHTYTLTGAYLAS